MQQVKFKNLLLGLSALAVSITTIAILSYGQSEYTTRWLIQYSAKLSTLLFALAFGASAWHYFFKSKFSKALLKYRAHIGLSFAFVHTCHLIYLLWLQQAIHPVFTLAKPTSLIAGGVAYCFIIAMAITTFPSMRAKLSKRNWRLLHLLGGYWIWIIFFRTYLKRIIEENYGYAFFILLIVVLVLRVLKQIALRKKSSSTAQ